MLNRRIVPLLKPVILFSDLALIAPFPKRLEICLRKSPKKVEAIEIYEEKKNMISHR